MRVLPALPALAVLAALAGSSPNEVRADPPAEAAPATIRLHGRVRLPDGSAPRGGAVFARAPDRKDAALRWIELAPDGAFETGFAAIRAPNPPDGRERFEVGAAVPGFLTLSQTVVATGDRADVDIRLPSQSLEGTVVDAAGLPIADLPLLTSRDDAVESTSLSALLGPRRLVWGSGGTSTPGLVRTDAHGLFRVGVPSGVPCYITSLSDAWALRPTGTHTAGEVDLRLVADRAFALRVDPVETPGDGLLREYQAVLTVTGEHMEPTAVGVATGEPSGIRLVRPLPTTPTGTFSVRLVLVAPDHEIVRAEFPFAAGARERRERVPVVFVPRAGRGRIVVDLGELGRRVGLRVERRVTESGVDLSHPVPIEWLGPGRYAAALPSGTEYVTIGAEVPFGALLAEPRELVIRPGETVDVLWSIAPHGSLRMRRTPSAGSPYAPYGATVRGNGRTAVERWLQGAEVEIAVFPAGTWEITTGTIRKSFQVTAGAETVVDLDR